MFHWTPSRIKGHLISCFLAFLLERTLEIKLRTAKKPLSPEGIRAAMLSMDASIIQQGNDTFFLRSAMTTAATDVLNALSLKHPKSFQNAKEFEES